MCQWKLSCSHMSHQHPEAVEEAMMTEVGMTRTKTRMCTNPREGDRHGKEIQGSERYARGDSG